MRDVTITVIVENDTWSLSLEIAAGCWRDIMQLWWKAFYKFLWLLLLLKHRFDVQLLWVTTLRLLQGKGCLLLNSRSLLEELVCSFVSNGTHCNRWRCQRSISMMSKLTLLTHTQLIIVVWSLVATIIKSIKNEHSLSLSCCKCLLLLDIQIIISHLCA